MQQYSYASEPKNSNPQETKIILPSYDLFVKSKADFQRGDASKEKVLRHLDTLSREIKELIKMLYRNTDTPEEREKINKLINEINVGNI